MLLNREDIPTQYDVLPLLPLPNAIEVIEWATNIFIASDLSEKRTALTNIPSIKLTYNFVLNCSSRTLINNIYKSKNEWLIPYLPYFTRGNFTIDGKDYPKTDYYVLWNKSSMVYKTHDNDDNTADITASVYWTAPCVVAYIKPSVSFNDVGRNRAGSTVSIEFTIANEQQLIISADSFDFINKLQSPIREQLKRQQTLWQPMPARAHTYTPYARMREETPIVDATYRLLYNDYQRDDYSFKGYWFNHLGSFSAGNYVDANKIHRIEDDKIIINYGWGAIDARLRLRELQNESI